MLYAILAIVGVIVVHFCDPAAIRRVPVLKPLSWLVGVGLVSYATLMACISPDKFAMPAWLSAVGWILLLFSTICVVYALFINLPFQKTYVRTGTSERLVTSGFYALARHPGVLWTALLLVGLILISRSKITLSYSPVLFILDLIVVAVQDRYYFVRMFPEYRAYQKTTPMLIPNQKSIQAFWAGIRARAQEIKEQQDVRVG
jgi:protein-S-isoprenylcysteine O-methyltransferase Ste14